MKELKIAILTAEHSTDLGLKIDRYLNNDKIMIKDIKYAIMKGMFSVLILYEIYKIEK